MTPNSDRNQRLERAIHKALRDVPARRAPQSLEQRVMAEIARRAALPWWRRSFVDWPVAARAAFMVFAVGLLYVVVMGSVSIAAGFNEASLRTAFATPLAWLEALKTLGNVTVGFFEFLLRNIPPLWIYGALAFAGTMYVALFGLGAAAYRTLYAHR